MVELADRAPAGKPTLVEALAKSQNIPKQYLHQLLLRLQAAGLVRAVRGRGGGYSLSRSASQITANDVLKALEGPISPVDCVQDPRCCRRSDRCATRGLWADLAKEIERVLTAATIEDLAARQRAAGIGQVAYDI